MSTDTDQPADDQTVDENCGLYVVTIDKNFYVGQSINLRTTREGEHRGLLRNGKHYNIRMQNAWNKYGEEAFSYRVLELCALEDLNARENFVISCFYGTPGCMNIEQFARGTGPMSDETKAKLSALTAAECLEARALRKEGHSVPYLMERFSAARATIYRILDGTPAKPRILLPSDAIVSQRLAGMPVADLAALYDVTDTTIYATLHGTEAAPEHMRKRRSEEVVALRLAGRSVADLAALYDVDAHTIYDILRGTEAAPKSTTLTADQRAEVIELRLAGHSVPDLMERFSAGRSTIYRVLSDTPASPKALRLARTKS